LSRRTTSRASAGPVAPAKPRRLCLTTPSCGRQSLATAAGRAQANCAAPTEETKTRVAAMG